LVSADIVGQSTIPAQEGILAKVEGSTQPVPDPQPISKKTLPARTMLIALPGGMTTRIVSINPNFPLAMEMASMGSRFGSLDTSARTHDTPHE
jgi:hypothetical protein